MLLYVECDIKSVTETEVGGSSVPKSTGKLFVVVGGDTVWYTMFADHVFDTHSC